MPMKINTAVPTAVRYSKIPETFSVQHFQVQCRTLLDWENYELYL
jgi:hypothetical protein